MLCLKLVQKHLSRKMAEENNSVQALKQQYIANFYAQKINQIEHKEPVLEQTKRILQEIVEDLAKANTK